MKLNFATIFDINYLSRGLILYESIKKWHDDFVLYVVCLDRETEDYFSKNKKNDIETIPLSQIEKHFPELAGVKKTRSYTDYIFTLSPYYPSYIIEKYRAISFICSLDCDQLFFSNSEQIFEDLNKYSVLITPHRFTEQTAHLIIHGKYNVSFQVFKNSETGRKCLELWRGQCLEWCSDILEDGKYADQKYLDSWYSYFGDDIAEIRHIGLGLAPWNLDDKRIGIRGKKVLVDNVEVILYHYHGLRFITKHLVNSGLNLYKVRPSYSFSRHILFPIVKGLRKFRNISDDSSIVRNSHSKSGSRNILKLINSLGLFLVLNNLFINLDLIYLLKTKRLKLMKM